MVIGQVRTVAERRWYGSSTTISSTNSSMTAGSEGAVSNMLTPEVGWLRCLVELINFGIGNSLQTQILNKFFNKSCDIGSWSH